MLKLNKLKKIIDRSCSRLFSSIDVERNITSTREREWCTAKEKYVNYDHVLYSSYLECQVEFMNSRLHKILERKLKKQSNYEARNKAFPTLKELNTMFGNQQIVETKIPKNWMEDYEFYEGFVDAAGNINSAHGTPDSTVPPSQVPCNGCGAHLHCASVSLPGYIPSEIFKGRTMKELQTIECQRCHFLKHYNIALDVEVTPESYVETIARIKNEFALALVIVDLLDMPCSIWPGMQQLLGSKRPVFVVGNKVDLLPRDSNGYLEHIKQCLKQQFISYGGFDALNIKNVSLISAKTGYGIEELITQLQKEWKHKGDVYLMGCTNVGKSSLFNTLLNSDYCRPEATELVRKATTCPWPGTTLQMLKFPILRPSDKRIYQRFRRLFSERSQRAAEEKLRRDQARKGGSWKAAQLIGRVGRTFDDPEDVGDAFAVSGGIQPITTLNERALKYREAKWCYDTPGVMQPEQITNLLSTEELLLLENSHMISPRAYRLKPNMTVFLAGLGRLDFVGSALPVDWIKIFVFSSLKLPVLITTTSHASEVYKKYLGTDLLAVPQGDVARLARWPGLQCKDDDIVLTDTRDTLQTQWDDELLLCCDITLSSAGWVGLALPLDNTCTFRAWTPHARGIFVRTPSIIPHANRLVGKRIRNSIAYNMAKPFVFQK